MVSPNPACQAVNFFSIVHWQGERELRISILENVGVFVMCWSVFLVLLLVIRIPSNLGFGTNCDEMGQTGGVTGVSSKVVGATRYLGSYLQGQLSSLIA